MATLTTQTLTQIEPPAKGNKLIFDAHRDAPKGFGLRVAATGGRAFVLRYRSQDGRDRLLTIGAHPTWSLAAARRQAAQYRREIDKGVDLLEQRRAEKAEPTVAEAVKVYCDRQAGKLASGKAIRATLTRHLVPDLGRTKLREVRRRDVVAVVERLAETKPRQASLLLTYVKQVFAWAEDREIIEANPVATLRPHKIAPGMAPKQRARVLSEEEIRKLWRADAGMAPETRVALKLVLVTGQRPGEVAGMRWSEISGRTWTIPASRRGKTSTEHRVPLSDTALELLAQVARPRPDDDVVFASRRGQPMTVGALSRAVSRCQQALGNDGPQPWTPHDLRRTCRTGLAAAGVGEVVAEVVIGHTRKGIAATYDQHKYEREKRQALEQWERRLLRIVAGESVEEDNVVAITGARR